MKFSTKSLPKWLLIPPAVALLLLLGTLSMGTPNNGTAAPTTAPTTKPASPAPAGDSGERVQPKAPALPRTPDVWQAASALFGVLVLGIGGLLMLRRLRNGPAAPAGAGLLTLRQTVRLPGRHALHAFEFDERIVLIGESEKGLVLLDRGRLPERAADEAEIATRGGSVDAVLADEPDEGAVPKNLVIPRPDRAPARPLPKPPTVPRPATPVVAEPAKARSVLTDFRALLQQVGRP